MLTADYQKISSPQNSHIKLLLKLKAKKYRQQSGQFSVENLAIIIDALKDAYDFEALFVTEEFADKHQEKLAYLQTTSRSQNFYLISAQLNKHYSSLDAPSGITAIYQIKPKELDETSVVYLDGISDPGNLGTIMRSALAFNFRNLVLEKGCADIYNAKVISAAKDAIFKLNIIEDKSGHWLKNNKLPIYNTSSHAGLDSAKFKPAKVFCLALGNESHGTKSALLNLAAKSIKIKISHRIESLNVATAAAILFYEFQSK